MNYDIVFIYMNAINGVITGAEYQLYSGYSITYLRKNNINAIQFINKDCNNTENIVEQLNALNTRYHVFYINEYNYYLSKVIINKLKKVNKYCKVIITGPSASFISDNLSEEVKFDICILRHEAMALKSIILNDGKELNQISNITFFEYGKVIKNKHEDFTYSLDDLGLPYSEGVIPVEEVQNVGMVTSIGCYGNCNFCTYRNLNPSIKIHSVENIIKELEYIRNYLGDSKLKIIFLDECFSISTNRINEICEKIYSKKFNYEFWCCTRADLLDYEVIDKMTLAGFRNIIIGLESASPEILEKVGKTLGKDEQRYIDNIENLYKYGKQTALNPMLSINFGLPFEKYEHAEKSMKFLVDNSLKDNVSICFTTCFPESRIFDDSENYEVSKKESPTILPYRTYYRNYDMRKVFMFVNKIGIPTLSKQSKIYYNNEIYKFYTGMYGANSYGSIRHINIDILSEREIEFIDNNLDINGSIFVDSNILTVKDRDLFCDDRKKLKVTIEQYDDNIRSAYKKDVYLSNQYFTFYKGKNVITQVNNDYMDKPLSNCFMEVDNNTLDYIDSEFEHFKNCNGIKIDNLSLGQVQNLCMFCGRCNINCINRVYMKDGKVLGCNKKDVIGTCDSSYEELIDNISKRFDERDKVRGCNNCIAQKWCSKCIFINETFKDKYCEFMKKNQDIDYYFKVLYLVDHIYKSIPNKGPIKIYSLKFHKQLVENNEEIGLDDNTFILEMDNVYFFGNVKLNQIKQCTGFENTLASYMLNKNDYVKEQVFFSELKEKLKGLGY